MLSPPLQVIFLVGFWLHLGVQVSDRVTGRRRLCREGEGDRKLLGQVGLIRFGLILDAAGCGCWWLLLLVACCLLLAACR